MRILVLFVLFLAACDKSKPAEAADDGPSVNAYCDKMLALDAKTAQANGAKVEDNPDVVAGCRMMLRRAKSEEPEAWACMAGCMLDADSREDEQRCTKKKKCLAKAKNPKLFSNRVD